MKTFIISLFVFSVVLSNSSKAETDQPVKFEIENERCIFSDFDAEKHCTIEKMNCKMNSNINEKPCVVQASPLPHEVIDSFIPVGICKTEKSSFFYSPDSILLFLPVEDLNKNAKDMSCAYVINKATLEAIIKDTKLETRKTALLWIYNDAFVTTLRQP